MKFYLQMILNKCMWYGIEEAEFKPNHLRACFKRGEFRMDMWGTGDA